MMHTHLPRKCVVFPLLCELTRLAIFDSHKWLTVLADEVKGKPRIFEAYLDLFLSFYRKVVVL